MANTNTNAARAHANANPNINANAAPDPYPASLPVTIITTTAATTTDDNNVDDGAWQIDVGVKHSRTSVATRQTTQQTTDDAELSDQNMSVILCTAGYDHTIRFWEALSGICSRTIQHPDSQVNRLCISPDKRYLAAAGRHSVKLFDIKNTNPNPILTFEGHTGNVTGVGFHCEGKWMVTSSEDGTVKIWDTRTAVVQRNYQHGHAVNDVVIHPNQGELISVDRGGNVRVWDLGQNRCTHHLVPEDDTAVASVTVASDGSMLCVGNNRGNVFAWRMLQNRDVTSLVPLAQFRAHHQYITRILLSPDVRHLATCSADHTARIWNADISQLNLDASTTNTGGTGGGGTTPTPSSTTTPPATATTTATTTTSSSSSSAFASSTSGASSSSSGEDDGEGESSNENLASAGASSQTLNGSTHTITNTNGTGTNNATGPVSSTTLAGGGSGTLSASTTPAATTMAFPLESTLHGHQRWVWDCAFSADSAYLVTACSDHYARLWELSSQTIIRQYNGHHRGAVCVALNDYSER
ncbi:MAG: hypothetical protein M1823_005381 [Watsoniomyces obsoletus]|nr:MAG: hypothetical protein M1823_005381 [Watsoniomyces obsoletus]